MSGDRAAMPDDFFAALYAEHERAAGDKIAWLEREGINPRAWIGFLDFLRREVRDGLEAGSFESSDAFDAAVASAMQVAWDGAKRAARDAG